MLNRPLTFYKRAEPTNLGFQGRHHISSLVSEFLPLSRCKYVRSFSAAQQMESKAPSIEFERVSEGLSLRFSFSEKATKIWSIFHLICICQTKWKITPNFGGFLRKAEL